MATTSEKRREYKDHERDCLEILTIDVDHQSVEAVSSFYIPYKTAFIGVRRKAPLESPAQMCSRGQACLTRHDNVDSAHRAFVHMNFPLLFGKVSEPMRAKD